MRKIEPGRGRAQLFRKGNELQIVVPPERSFLMFIFFGFFAFVGMFVGDGVVSNFSFPDSASELFSKNLFALAFVTFWWFLVLKIFGSLLLKKELVKLDNTYLVHKKAILGVGLSRAFMVSQIKKLRAEIPPPADDGEGGKTAPSPGKRNILFDYGHTTQVIATNLDAAEADYILEEMCKQARSLGVPK